MMQPAELERLRLRINRHAGRAVLPLFARTSKMDGETWFRHAGEEWNLQNFDTENERALCMTPESASCWQRGEIVFAVPSSALAALAESL